MPPDDDDGIIEFDHDDSQGESEMADLAENAHVQNMSSLMQAGTVAARIIDEHSALFVKLADYDYLEGHRQVSLVQALGAREVGSKMVPAGPNTIPPQ